MGRYSRRAALGAIGTGAGLLIANSLAVTSNESDRVGDIKRVTDPNGVIGLDGDVFTTDGLTEPQPFDLTNHSASTFTKNDTIKISSREKKFVFRIVSDNNTKNTLTETEFNDESKLPFDPGDTISNIEILTDSDQTGTVTDAVAFRFISEKEGLVVEFSRDVTLKFRATGQLVYAHDGDIKVYDTLNDKILDPPEDSNVDSVGSIVADITGDGDADIAYVLDTELDLTQSNPPDAFPTTVFDSSNSSNDFPEPNKNKTRVAAGDLANWPMKDGSDLIKSVALFTDSNQEKIYAAQPKYGDGEQAVEVLIDTSNVGGAGGVTGIEDIDNDGLAEVIYINGSQALNFIKQIDTTQYSSPSDWTDEQSNYEQVLPEYKDGNGGFTNTIGDSDIVLGKAKLGNASVGSNNNVGISAPGEFSNDSKKYIPFIDGSGVLAFIDHTNTKIAVNNNLKTADVALKAAIAPVDVDADDVTELFFIGKPEKSGANGPLPPIDEGSVDLDGSGPVYYLNNPIEVLDNAGTPDFSLLRPPLTEAGSNGIVEDDDGNVMIIPDATTGLNAGTRI